MSARGLTRRLLAVLVALAAGAPAAAEAALPPAGVTGFALDGKVELAWQPVAGATGYNVYRGTSPSAVTTPLMASPLTPPGPGVPVTFTDVSSATGTTYYYAVRDVVSGVESANSRIVKATPRARSCSGGNVVVLENCFPGDSDWNVPSTSQAVSGFGTAQSIAHGEAVDLKLAIPSSTTTADVEIFRTGWYGGAGARLVSTVVGVPIGSQPACENDLNLGLLDCSTWSVGQTLTTTTTWPSGVYLVRVRRNDTTDETHILLVVRDDTRRAEVLYGLPDTTYQAYNAYGGKSLYDHQSSGANTVSGQARAVKVSYDRPYLQPQVGAEHDWYTRADIASVWWLERSGYDVSYEAASDLERRAAHVLDHRVFISGSHDEYWSLAMRQALEAARDRGVDLFFTGANEVFWKVRFEPSPATGRSDRVLVCYKSSQSGGPDPSGIPTSTWRDPAGANAPENALSGEMFIGQKPDTYFPLKVSAAEGKDRVWRNTTLATQGTGASTNVGTGIVGWEWDARVTNGAEPPGVTTLASSPVTGDIYQGVGNTFSPGTATTHVVKHQVSSGALVVATGTNHWNWGLALNGASKGEPDSRIQQATTNILLDMGAAPETPAAGIVLDDPAAPPLVTSKAPANGATRVQPTATVRATFSRAMNASTITAATFTLTPTGGSPVPATVGYDDITFAATLIPQGPLALDTVYTARLDPTIKASNGIALGSATTWSFTTRPPDTTAPVISITSPQNGDVVVAGAQVNANASDDDAVAGVQFRLDGGSLGPEDTAAPYSYTWDARGVSAGSHQLSAVARDPSGNMATSSSVTVTVDPSGLVAAYGFEETTGTALIDSSGKVNNGTINGATRAGTGKFGRALSFDGINDRVDIPDAASLDLTTAMTLEAWLSPSATGGWRTALMKEQTGGLVYGIYANTDTNRPSAHVFTTTETDTRGTTAIATGTWTHLAATFDGATLRIYVNGTQASARTLAGSMITSTGALRIGGNSVWGEYFAGLIDEVRVYRRALSAAELQTDMSTSIVAPDTQAPTAPGPLTATGGLGSAQLSWGAASDNTTVVHYNVHRSPSSGFTPTAANRIAQVTGLTYTDTGRASGDWFYRVTAEDAAANVGPASNEAKATVTADTTSPTVSLTAPANGSTVSGNVSVSATAADDVGVAGVRFTVDGADVAAEDTTSPYAVTWDSRTVANGSHTLRAVARDAAGNATTSAAVIVTVDTPPVDTSGLVGAWGFEAGSGTVASDSSTAGNNGAVAGGAAWTDAGRFGKALTFDGIDDRVNVADADSLDLAGAMTLEAWVKPSQHAEWRTVLLKESPSGLAYALYSSSLNDLPSGHINTGSERNARGTTALPLNTWSHLAVTYDGTTLRLFVNGEQVASTALAGPIQTTAGALRIGGNAIWGESFKGSIDEVRVYRRALTAFEIGADMQAPVVAGPPPAGPEATGEFSGVINWPLVPVHIASLSNGRIAVWDGFDAAINSERVWDPNTGTFDPIPNGRNLFCSAHVTLPDGRLFIAGGHLEANDGLKDTWLFTPSDRSWFRGPDMANGRWYPTATTLPDGRVLVVSGDNITLNAPGQTVPLTNASQTLPEIYDVDRNTWAPLTAAQRRMPLYPFMFVLPNGKVFDAGPDLVTRTLDVSTGAWTTVGSSPIDGHSAVMYRPGKILKSGTWGDPDFPNRVVDGRAAAIDMTAGTPAWREVAPMRHPRSFHTLTALLDGTVLASGGASASDGIDPSKAVFGTEIWDPVTETWTETASHQRPRLYHSSATLLSDGRVLLAGGGAFGSAANEANAEIFSPPYLFKGIRPTITVAPTLLRHGQTFSVTTPEAANIQKVSFVRMGSVTHNFDMDQRFMNLTVRPGSTSGTLSVDAPPDANVAPPGWYFLSVLDDKGIPSKGWIVKLDKPATDTQGPTQPGGLTTSVLDDDVKLDWNASTDNTGVTGYTVHRSTTSGFTPSAANRIATVTSATTYTDGNLAAGTYYYVAIATDAAGNVSPSSLEASATVPPDTTPPTVAITAPTAGTTVSGTVTVAGSASDTRGVTSVQFRLDGANLGVADTTSPYSLSWDTKTVINGPHMLTAVARDAAGNAATSAGVGVTVDNGAPPTVAITAPTAGATITGTVSVTAGAQDDRGLTSLQFRLDGADLGAADTTSPYAISWDTRTASNGAHALTAIARDTDGNTTTSAAVSVTVSNTTPPPTGIVAAYGFEEPSGTTVTDMSGNGLDGSISGSTRTTPGRFGAALSFDGVNDWVTVPDANALDLTNAMTIEAWVRPTVLSSWVSVITKEQAAQLAYGLYANSSTNRPTVNIFTSNEKDVRGTAKLAINAWTHLAATYDGVTLRLYVNGTNVKSGSFKGTIATSTGPLRLGGNAFAGEWFTGLIDEVRVYNRALTVAEVQTDMTTAVKP